MTVALQKVQDLRYGENPHQASAWYAEEPRTALGDAAVLQGKELSYTNLLDLDAAARIVLEFDEPAAAVIKHTNPCGAATGSERRRRLRARARGRSAVGVRRHRRAQPADRRRRGRGARVHETRRGDRAGRWPTRRAPSWRRRRTCGWSPPTSRACAPTPGRELRSILGAVLRAGARPRRRGRRAVAVGRSAGGDEAAADRGGVDGAALRVARSART